MDFDQMLDAWRAQDERPIYGVNRDLLQLVLQNERAAIRRSLRRDQWITYLVGSGMAAFQRMFSESLHAKGRFFSVEMPCPLGPRNSGQVDSAWAR